MPYTYGNVEPNVYSPKFDQSMRERSQELRTNEITEWQNLKERQYQFVKIGSEINSIQKQIYIGDRCKILPRGKGKRQDQNQQREAPSTTDKHDFNEVVDLDQMEFKLSLKGNTNFDMNQQQEFDKLLKLANRLEKRHERKTDKGNPAFLSSDSDVEDDNPELNKKMYRNDILKQRFKFIKAESMKK